MFRTTTTFAAIVLAVGVGTTNLDGSMFTQANAPQKRGSESRFARNSLDGKWEVLQLTRGDIAKKVLPEEDMTGTVEIKGKVFHFTINSLGQEMDRWDAKMSADYFRTPGSIDLSFDSGPDRGRTVAGIFKLNGDELQICLPIRPPFDERPAEFNAAQGTNRVLFVLHRIKS
ncbi:MAG TPA: TIGR03067 domain-containing protein [Fimbriiglobus sp.]|jgi:uncharacterized protein (TIGR03067 family)